MASRSDRDSAEQPEQSDSDRPTVPSGANEWVERNERFERKLRFGKIVLQLLPADDARARVLRTAIAERDEALLEGLLNSLDQSARRETAASARDLDAPPSSSRVQRRTLLPPPRNR